MLDEIVAAKCVAAERLVLAELKAAAADAPPARDFAGALRDPGVVRVIAEFKRRSPSAGWIREGADAAAIATGYAVSGAAALSVLTDTDWFGGTLDDLRAARAAAGVPVLRKDFVVAAEQIWEARAAGADAVLLIVRILDDAALTALLDVAVDAGVAALVEVHSEAELERALEAGAGIVGVNNRDLSVFRTDLAVSERLAPLVPPGVVLVGESGIATASDVERLGRAGVNAVLMGETLMRASDPAEALRTFVGRARSERT